MSDVVIKREDKDYKLTHLNEIKDFKFIGDKDYVNSVKLVPTHEELVINSEFFISIANLDILSELNIPSIFAQVVTQDKWIKID